MFLCKTIHCKHEWHFQNSKIRRFFCPLSRVSSLLQFTLWSVNIKNSACEKKAWCETFVRNEPSFSWIMICQLFSHLSYENISLQNDFFLMPWKKIMFYFLWLHCNVNFCHIVRFNGLEFQHLMVWKWMFVLIICTSWTA